jgi:hypothetical protein
MTLNASGPTARDGAGDASLGGGLLRHSGITLTAQQSRLRIVQPVGPGPILATHWHRPAELLEALQREAAHG